MKINVQNILTAVLVGLLIWQMFFTKKDVKEPMPVQIVIPGIDGTSGTNIIEQVKTVPIFIHGNGQIMVDERYKDEYLNAKDSIERLNQYLKAIQIKEITKTFVDNDTIRISGLIKTRGDLLEYKFDYKIKDRKFDYLPESIVRRPKFSLSVEADAGIPTVPNTGFLMRGAIGLENKRGEALSIGYDTENRVWLGIRKNFSILK